MHLISSLTFVTKISKQFSCCIEKAFHGNQIMRVKKENRRGKNKKEKKKTCIHQTKLQQTTTKNNLQTRKKQPQKNPNPNPDFNHRSSIRLLFYLDLSTHLVLIQTMAERSCIYAPTFMLPLPGKKMYEFCICVKAHTHAGRPKAMIYWKILRSQE